MLMGTSLFVACVISNVQEMWLLMMISMRYSHMDSMHLSTSMFNTPAFTDHERLFNVLDDRFRMETPENASAL